MLKKQIKLYKDSENILIYQMGKVGSTTLYESIPNSTHFHTLYDRKCCKFYQEITNQSIIKRFLIRKIKLYYLKKRKKIKIITLVRNPYERNVSHYFQDLQFWLPYYTLSLRGFRNERPDLITDCFEEKFNFDYAKYWFEEELTRFSGIRIEDCNFNKERGYGIVKKGKFEVLFLTMEKMDSLEKEISKFLETEIKLLRHNTGGKKWYHLLYKDFKENYTPSLKAIENSFDAGWVKEFYSEKDIALMKDRALRDIKNQNKEN